MSASLSKIKEYTGRKFRCYFAHPYSKISSPEKFKIIKELELRGVEVIDPFDGEDKILEKYGVKEYYENPKYKLGREIWIKDLEQIRNFDMILAWIEGPSIGVSAEIQEAYRWGKFIQIISPIRHPSFAYVLTDGNQQFETVEDFINRKNLIWD